MKPAMRPSRVNYFRMKKLRFKGQVYAGFVVSIALIVATAVFFYSRITHAIHKSGDRIQHSIDALANLDSISWQNGNLSFEILVFLANRNPERLYTAKLAQTKISQQLAQLDNNVRKLGLGGQTLDRLRHTLASQDSILTTYFEDDIPVRTTPEWIKIKYDNLTLEIAQCKQTIIAERQAGLAAQARSFTQTKYLSIAGLSIAVLFLLALVGYIVKTFDLQKQAERMIRKSNADLSRLSEERKIDNWILNGLALLDSNTRGGLSEEEIAAKAIQTVCHYLNAKIGLLYVKSTSNDVVFNLSGSYAAATEHAPKQITGGQGLIGESLLSQKQIIISDIPADYLPVSSSLGNAKPKHIVIQPLVYENEVTGIIEIGFFRDIDDSITRFLDKAGINLGVTIKVARAHSILSQLYEETQQQAEELEAQQEELRTTNDELVHKTHLLEASEEELRVQQEELRQANTELEEKARLLEERNLSIEQARQSIVMKANELEQSGKYKSEFLANMSHELRTPLNSILILAKLLEDNKSGNLLPDQVKYASVIHHAGSDLLNLINNILDLSKIESGSVELIVEQVLLSDIATDMLELFGSVADSKSIDFHVVVAEGLPPAIEIDEQRLRQILKNLLSNAFKFTKEKGRVELLITPAVQSTAWKAGLLAETPPNEIIALSVTDTGIGIPEDKQQLIFDAFKQADGSTSRKFGGTGLGLSICRELAVLLGGEIRVESQKGKGSTFTLFLPLQGNAQPVEKSKTESKPSAPAPVKKQDDREDSTEQTQITGLKRLLIIEDDRNFAEILDGYARERGFDTIVAHQGDTGLQMALEHRPDAIILDIVLPVMDGWAVLKSLKENPKTQNIPVHLMSADCPSKQKIEESAVGFLQKPIDQKSLDDAFGLLHRLIASPLKTVLIIEDHKIQSDSLKSRFIESGVEVKQAFTGNEALDSLRSGTPYDCIILDINLPDRSGMDLLDEIKTIPKHAETPIIINTAMELNPEMTSRILHHTQTMVIKSDKSNTRILDEVNLFINKVKNNSAPTTTFQLSNPNESKIVQFDKVLEGKHLLLADDDMRNIFALGTVLELHRMKVDTANNGLEALDILKHNPDIDLVLMDIMMPEMDGYEAIKKIREMKKFAKLPIIAITAKAMQDDRQRVLDAGANDYIAKPVDANKLLSLIRVWLS